MNKGYLYSKANYPIPVKYGKDTIILPPNAKKYLIEDITLLGALPPKVRLIEEGGK